MSNLSRALKLVRTYHNLNQKEMAEKLEISNSYLCEIEKGKKEITFCILKKYSEIFKIPVSNIVLFSEKIDSEIPRQAELMRVCCAEKILKLLEFFDSRKNKGDLK